MTYTQQNVQYRHLNQQDGVLYSLYVWVKSLHLTWAGGKKFKSEIELLFTQNTLTD